MIIKFTQRDGYGSSIEFIERRGSDGADVDEKNNGFGPACRNSKRLVEYIGGFAAVQTFVSKTTYLTSAAIGIKLTQSLKNTTIMSNIAPARKVDKRVRPPDFTLITD